MKFNWGTGIMLFFILFVAALAFVLYQSRQQDHSLVIDNYYEEDLKYQQQYDKLKNASELDVKIIVTYEREQKELLLKFPSDSVSGTFGTIILYNPAFQKSDVKYDFNLGNESLFKIPVDKVTSGRWKLKIDWQQGDKKYYQEEEVII